MKTAIIGAIVSIVGSLPGTTIHYEAPQPERVRAIVTAYTSSEDETDDTPHITASGERTRDGIVANNCLKFGTVVEIDSRHYEVQDRLNKRYGCERFDIWMESKGEAFEWGRRELSVAINGTDLKR